jgi:hypothetical protein
MASAVNAGRYTHAHTGDITVFLIGMRFGKPWRVAKWWPVFTAMPPMLRHLSTQPESGLLGHHIWPGRTTLLLSYWRSPEHLMAFASDPAAPHLEPWRRFNKTIGSDPSVGVWHETYQSHPGDYEAVYVNMPAFGLGRASGVQRVGKGTATARQRLRATWSDDLAPDERLHRR